MHGRRWRGLYCAGLRRAAALLQLLPGVQVEDLGPAVVDVVQLVSVVVLVGRVDVVVEFDGPPVRADDARGLAVAATHERRQVVHVRERARQPDDGRPLREARVTHDVLRHVSAVRVRQHVDLVEDDHGAALHEAEVRVHLDPHDFVRTHEHRGVRELLRRSRPNAHRRRLRIATATATRRAVAVDVGGVGVVVVVLPKAVLVVLREVYALRRPHPGQFPPQLGVDLLRQRHQRHRHHQLLPRLDGAHRGPVNKEALAAPRRRRHQDVRRIRIVPIRPINQQRPRLLERVRVVRQLQRLVLHRVVRRYVLRHRLHCYANQSRQTPAGSRIFVNAMTNEHYAGES